MPVHNEYTGKLQTTRHVDNAIAVTEDIVLTTGDDAGWSFPTGQVAIGSAGNGQELIAGEGDSFPCTYAYHYDGADFTDVTAIWQSDSDSNTTLFPDTNAGSMFYIGHSGAFYGLKMKVLSVLDPTDVDKVVSEYWDFGAEDWLPVETMTTDADAIYPPFQFGNRICNAIGSEHWRYNFDPYSSVPVWGPTTVNGQFGLFGRMRITSNLTLNPSIEQVKCHTSRWECNANGATEYFGTSRYQVTLQSGIGSIIDNSAASPANQNVTYGLTATVANYGNNQLSNNAVDSFLLTQNILTGLDTSIKLEVAVSYYVEGTATGDVEWELHSYNESDGYVYGAGDAPTIVKVVDTIGASSDLIRRTVKLYVDVSMLDDEDSVVLKVLRDATGGNAEDTLAAAVVVTGIRLTGYMWR